MPNIDKSSFSRNIQIQDPDKIFIVFPIAALYFGEIQYPENTPPDPVQSYVQKWRTTWSLSMRSVVKCRI